MRVRPQIEAARQLQPIRRLEEQLFANQDVAHGPRRIRRRGLRKPEPARVDQAPLRKYLRACMRAEELREQYERGCPPHCRRSACKVKLSSFIGKLYCTLSSESRVLLPRRRSVITV